MDELLLLALGQYGYLIAVLMIAMFSYPTASLTPQVHQSVEE